MIFGMRELEAQRLALVARSGRLREDLAAAVRPLSLCFAIAQLRRTSVRWASRALLFYSLLKRR